MDHCMFGMPWVIWMTSQTNGDIYICV
ncbi:unnamed protein product, partial [Adineta steineri]